MTLGEIKSDIMSEEMIREKEAFGGCLFTGCACFLVGSLLLIMFIFFRSFFDLEIAELNIV